jgi:peroxidase
LDSDFKTFDDLLAIFPKNTVDLLKQTYDSVEDIDLYVGGVLETYSRFGTLLAGETFGCIIEEQYRNSIGGDAYYYSHETNPYPFTTAQIAAIESFSFLNLFCLNSELEFVPKIWYLLEGPTNPKVACSNFKKLDLSAWISN